MAKRGGPEQQHNLGSSDGAIPDKLYFRIGEVADLCHVPTYVLRFWQTEFPQLKPGKSGTGQRLYRRRDVEMALRIKGLLHDEGYTIAGAKTVLAGEAAALPQRLQPEPPQPEPLRPTDLHRQPELPLPQSTGDDAYVHAKLRHVRGELRELLGLLERKPTHYAAPVAVPDDLLPIAQHTPENEP